jgi:hypothetical protein
MNLGAFLRDLADDLEVALDAGDDDLAAAIVADLRSVGGALPDAVLEPAFACPHCAVVRDTRARLELHVEQTHPVKLAAAPSLTPGGAGRATAATPTPQGGAK